MCLFFQAEDGIRDRDVTGVQTCALPSAVSFSVISLVFVPCEKLNPSSTGISHTTDVEPAGVI